MKKPPCEGIFVVLLPTRGPALVDVLREASRQFLGEAASPGWAVEYGPLAAPAGAVAFRLTHPTEAFPWREGAFADLARTLSKLGPGRCWALGMEKGGGEGWAEGVVFDRGEQAGSEEATGADAPSTLTAWFGEQLALSENEVIALFSACDQRVALDEEGGDRVEDEIDQLLDRARKEFARYRELKEQRERSEGSGQS